MEEGSRSVTDSAREVDEGILAPDSRVSPLTLGPLNQDGARRLLEAITCRSQVDLGFTIYSISRVLPVEQSFDADIRIYCRWYDPAVASDPDMIALKECGTLANGTVIPRRSDGYFPEAVVRDARPAAGGSIAAAI